MLKYLFNTSYIAELCAFIAAILFLRKKTGLWQLFALFLLLTILVETSGWYIYRIGGKSNHWLYYFFNVIECIFYVGMLANSRELIASAKKIYKCIYLLLVFAILNFFIQFFISENSYTKILADILCFFVCCFFFVKVLADKENIALLKYEYFWLATGVIFEYLGSAAGDIYRQKLTENHIRTGVPVFTYIMNAVDVLLYGCLIVSFMFRRNNSK